MSSFISADWKNLLIITAAVALVTLVALFLNRRATIDLKKGRVGIGEKGRADIDVAENIHLQQSEVGNIVGVELGTPGDIRRVAVAANASVTNTKVGDIVGVRASPRRTEEEEKQ